MFKNLKLSTKIIIGILIWAIVTLVVLIVATNNLAKSATQKSIGESSVTLAKETMNKIDRHIYFRIEEMHVYSKDEILKEVIKKSNQEFDNMPDREAYIQEKDREWQEAEKGTVTPFMQGLMDSELAKELKGKVEFYEGRYGYKVFPEVYVTNKYGVVIATTGKTSDYLQADEEWYQNAVKEKDFWVGNIEYDESSETYASDIVINLYDEQGNFAGVLKPILNMQGIVDIIKELKTEPVPGHEKHVTMNFKLLTEDGKIIYSDEPFEIFQDVYDAIIARFGKFGEPGHRDYFVGQGDMPGEGEELFAHSHSKGYRDYKGLGWYFIIDHDAEEVFAPVVALNLKISLLLIFIFILAIITALSLITKGYIKPVISLAKIAQAISAGDLTKRAEVKSKDEIGQLAASFNAMTDKLFEARKLPESILRSMKDSLFVVDTKGNIADVNEAGLEVLGYKKEELVGKPISKVFGIISRKHESTKTQEKKPKVIKYIPAPDQEEDEETEK